MSIECDVEVHHLDEGRREDLDSIEEGLKRRTVTTENKELDRAKQQIGELAMENELLRVRIAKKGPLTLRKSNK